ncbi:hypothetical protein [Tianweitania sediminis]|uniref:Uncharacterized protein n=1 Tax=Tianweitania sediminis TaxID=1502156 RepID=A0A8J7RJE5_9HYPH|nr:hypothetical protein [Tianweitania sediminis]MBP0439556.1 hypothetical protein [Tianweitania sediminis]
MVQQTQASKAASSARLRGFGAHLENIHGPKMEATKRLAELLQEHLPPAAVIEVKSLLKAGAELTTQSLKK